MFMKSSRARSESKGGRISENVSSGDSGRCCVLAVRVVVGVMALAILSLVFELQLSSAENLPSTLAASTNNPSPVRVSDNYVEKAICEIQAGESLAALEYSERAAAANPDSAIALAVYGLSQLQCGRWSEAELWLKQALVINSMLPEAHLGLAEIAYGRMHYDLAIAHADKAVSSQHLKMQAHTVQAATLEEINLHDQASQAMREAYRWSEYLPEYHRKNIQNWSEIYSSYQGHKLHEIPDDFTSTVIPFTNYQGHALLSLTADGLHLDSVLLDTGFGGSLMISPKDAERLELQYSGQILTRSFYGEIVIKIALIDSVQLGDVVVNNVPAYVCDIPGGFGGLIGWQLLKNFNFSIDFTSSRIAIFGRQYSNLQKDMFSEDKYLDRVPFLYDKNIRITACIGEKKAQHFVFDTGASYPSLHVDPSNDTAAVRSESRTSIEIGHFVFDNAKFLYYDLSSIHEIGRYYFDGIIGISIFQNSILHFNPGESALYVECSLQD
jgi:tetratricopeptide (TPR) repeat protein